MFTTNDPYAHLRSKVSSDPAEGEAVGVAAAAVQA
jgi:hypothetical protein